jgi:CheY-like chemotaxis protein
MASIMVSEADPDVQRLLEMQIERLGHEAVVVDRRVEIPPRADLLVFEPSSDWCVRQARLARLFFPRISLLCMGAAPDAAEFLADGVVAYLEKPFTIEALQAAISELVPVVAQA